MSGNNEIALIEQNSGFLKLADPELAQIIAEELNGLDITFDRIKMPSTGSTTFLTPGKDGEPESVKEFSGVILYHHPLFTYYSTKFTGGNNPPDCGSYDGVTGQGVPGGKCATCKYNQFGSGENDGKACKNRHRLYILRERELFPIILNVPPMSVRPFTDYLKQIITAGKRAAKVVTQFSIQTSRGSKAYPLVQFKEGRDLTPCELAVITPLSTQIKARSLQVAIDDDPLVDAVEDYSHIDPETGEIINQ